ncbi:hypothetical protein [Chromohalobacter sp. 296-RDG]|uniref:hypothetical protein n=1 Tax=Chromohalobacter sp. 296-RDG TaxID=2994062 RepID=UPI00246828A5|nr:hypothetical protein [Chromohalobacter sp. 296-RDG]
MAKRITKTETKGVFWLAVIGFPIYWIAQMGESVGWIPLTVVVIAAIALYVFYQLAQTKKRREALMRKYGDENLVDALMNRTFWQGQTGEQLLDSLGKPHDIDQKLLKTKKKEVWKYNHQGFNRYGLRINLDNDQVVGWDQKT